MTHVRRLNIEVNIFLSVRDNAPIYYIYSIVDILIYLTEGGRIYE